MVLPMNRTLNNAPDQKTLEGILNEHRAGNDWQLPNLKVEPSYWDQLMDRFTRWLNSLFPQFDLPNTGIGNTLVALMTVLKYLLVIAVVAAAIWIIYSLVRFALRKAPPEKVFAPRDVRKREELEDLLSAAERAGDWALAARIAWKMFLRATEETNSRTPFEYSGRYPRSIPDLKLPYHLMFAVEPKNKAQLSSWREVLAAIENKRGEP